MEFWLPIVVSLLSGGAMGAFIKMLVDIQRNKIQPVSYGMAVQQISGPAPDHAGLNVNVTVGIAENSFAYPNLSIVQITLVNSGNKDLSAFRLGITLGEGERAIFASGSGPDHLNTITLVEPCDPQNERTEVDFNIQPFNRRKVFSIDLFVVVPQGKIKPEVPQLSSSASVRFSAAPSMGEMMLTVSKSMGAHFLAQYGIKL